MKVNIIFCVGALGLAASLSVLSTAGAPDRNGGANSSHALQFPDRSGEFETISTSGSIDFRNPFFQSLGTNGRSCATCHQPSAGWTVTPESVRERFDTSHGTDPIFRPIDGATCSSDDISTVQARREAYKLLLTKGLVRIALGVPDGADFIITGVDTPYACNDLVTASVYRRPLPATNLKFLSTVMWDGREFPVADESKPWTEAEVDVGLHQQAIDAILGHAQASHSPSAEEVDRIVDFEKSLFTAQTIVKKAGSLREAGAVGGPNDLPRQTFFLGINDPLGGNPTGAPFNPNVFNIFKNWIDIQNRNYDEFTKRRESIARGEVLFNTHAIAISGVAGLNDVPLADGRVHAVIEGSCSTCHSSPGAGDHSLPAPLNIGISDATRRTTDLPLFTILCNSGAVVQTTDPGRALVTGKCADIGKFKGPTLRGLAARGPYFHNGMAATLKDVVDFYQERFNLGFSDQEQRDLVNFLKSL
ncbi:MAG: hypothetical protein ACRD40_10010 [Candidatus Acidiferrales bacterium]